MSGDLADDITPPEGVPISPVEEQGRSERAEVRPGPHVRPPDPTDDEWLRLVEVHRSTDQVIVAARRIIRLAARPMADASWWAIRRDLMDARDRLVACGDEESRRKLAIVHGLLRGDRHA